MGAVVAVLTWRGENVTRACLESLRDRGGWSGPTLVVDNASGTGEGERLAAEFGATVVVLPENGGVAAGYNAAVQWARDHGLSHVLLTNNDLEFTSRALADELEQGAVEGVAAIGPLIRTKEGSVWSAGVQLRSWIGHAQRLAKPAADTRYAVDALDGSCMLVSVDAVCKVGGLDPTFFLYWEETDWCTRARRAGLRVLVDPSLSVKHIGWGSGDRRQTRRYALRNSLLYARRNIRGPASVSAALVWLLARAPAFLVRRSLEGATPRSVIADLGWAIRWNLADAQRRGWQVPANGPQICL